jgi:hypothetical protein
LEGETARPEAGLLTGCQGASFLRIECDRCGKVTMLNEAHMSQRQRATPIRVLLARMRHEGCGGRCGGSC